MSYTYNYTREKINGVYNVPNYNAVEDEEEPSPLWRTTKDDFPNHEFDVCIDGDDVCFIFQTELTAQEQTDLTTSYNNHINAT